MVCDLPHPHQHRQHLELRLRRLRLHPHLVRQTLLLLAHRTVGDAHDLVRQILGDILLESSQDERMDLVTQLLERGGTFASALLRRRLGRLLEGGIVPEIVRQQEIEDAPHVRDGVLHRRAGEHELLDTAEQLGALGVARGAVLDVLRLVQHDHGEDLVEIRLLQIALEQCVGGDHEIGLRNPREVLLARRAGDDEPLQPRREFRRLRLPVPHERGGAHDERGTPGGGGIGPLERKPGERLKRLAESHLVGQQTGKPALLQEAHPVHTLLLVRTERVLQRTEIDRLELRAFVAVARDGRLVPGRRLVVIEAASVKRLNRALHVGGVDSAHAEESGRRIPLRPRAVGEHILHVLDGLGIQEKRLSFDHQETVPPVQGLLHQRPLHGTPVQLKGVAHVEGAARRIPHLHHGNDRRDRIQHIGETFRNLHAPSMAPQIRQTGTEKIQHVILIDQGLSLPFLKTVAPQETKRPLLGIRVPYMVDERIVGILPHHGIDIRRATARQLHLPVPREHVRTQ